MKKVHLKTTFSETEVLNIILSDMRAMQPSHACGLEIEILLMHEFHDRYMSTLRYPDSVLNSERGKYCNKFTMPHSTALALAKTLIGYDMSSHNAYSAIMRDDVVNRILPYVSQHFSTPIAAYLNARKA